MKKLSLILLLFTAVSCTQNSRAKNWGGTSEVTLPHNQKLINVTWKDNDLWYLTRPMSASDSAETYEFKEKSSWGIWQGTYIINESKIVQ